MAGPSNAYQPTTHIEGFTLMESASFLNLLPPEMFGELLVRLKGPFTLGVFDARTKRDARARCVRLCDASLTRVKNRSSGARSLSAQRANAGRAFT